MPTLKQLTCRVEKGFEFSPLREYSTKYADGVAATFVAIPSSSGTPFSIRLTSEGFIASGLAMFVYIDGEYQCNRNRTHLIKPFAGTNRQDTEIFFRVRSQETIQADGSFIARGWRFETLDTSK